MAQSEARLSQLFSAAAASAVQAHDAAKRAEATAANPLKDMAAVLAQLNLMQQLAEAKDALTLGAGLNNAMQLAAAGNANAQQQQANGRPAFTTGMFGRTTTAETTQTPTAPGMNKG
jgi:hypothetical protein